MRQTEGDTARGYWWTGTQELPIRADFVGKNVPTSHTELIDGAAAGARRGDRGISHGALGSFYNIVRQSQLKYTTEREVNRE